MRRRLVFLGCVTLLGLVTAVWPAGAATCSPDSRPSLASANLRDQQLQLASLACANLRGADLDGLDLSQANLSNADLTGASLVGASLTQADLTHADLRHADAEHAQFGQATLTGATLTGVDARYADFTKATLTGADLSGADLTQATLDQSQSNGARLDGAHLAGASLVQVNDSGASASHAAGLLPADALGGVGATLIAWIALWRWWRRPRRPVDEADRNLTRGRILAGAVACVVLVGFVASVVGIWNFLTSPTFVTWLTIVPLVFLVAVGTLLVVRPVRRVRSPFVAVALAVAGAAGMYLFCAAGVAGALEGVELTAFADSCGGIDCAGGLTRGWAGLGVGLAVLIVVWVIARQPGVARPGSGLTFQRVNADDEYDYSYWF